MKKKRSGWRIFRTLLLLAALAAAAVYVLDLKGIIHIPDKYRIRKAADTSQEAELPKASAEIGKISVTTEGNGTIEPFETRTEAAPHTLRIEHVEVENGDTIRKGDAVALIDVSSIEDDIDSAEAELEDMTDAIANMSKGGSSSVTASVGGRVKRIFVEKGDYLPDVVKKHGGIIELSVDGRLRVEFTSSRALSMGEEVRVTFSGREENGRVVSADGDLYTVTFPDRYDNQVDETAEVLDLDGIRLGSGRVATNAPYLVDTKYGVCDGINVSVGDQVDSGTKLISRTTASYNADFTDAVSKRNEKSAEIKELREFLDDPVIRAGEGGIISEIAIADRQVIQKDAPMYTVISTEAYRLKVQIDELDIDGVAKGQGAAVVFDAFDDEEYEGMVEKVSSLGTNTGGVATYTVTVKMTGVDKIKPGMSATANITIKEKDGALLVPIDAVRTVDGARKVTVVKGDVTEERSVELGLVSNTMAEIVSGVSEGEEVVIYESDDTDWMIQMMQRNRENSAWGAAG